MYQAASGRHGLPRLARGKQTVTLGRRNGAVSVIVPASGGRGGGGGVVRPGEVLAARQLLHRGVQLPAQPACRQQPRNKGVRCIRRPSRSKHLWESGRGGTGCTWSGPRSPRRRRRCHRPVPPHPGGAAASDGGRRPSPRLESHRAARRGRCGGRRPAPSTTGCGRLPSRSFLPARGWRHQQQPRRAAALPRPGPAGRGPRLSRALQDCILLLINVPWDNLN